MSVRILIGDCMVRMAELPDGSVDSCVTDPPYHLTSIVKRFGKEGSAPAKVGATGAYERASRGFMGQQWDGGDVAFRPETWAEVLRVLKPGGHLVAFSGTRTYHRMACAIEDAGFEIRDQIMWHYGSGFPKSHNVGKAITALQRHGGSAPRNLREARLGADYAPTGQADYRKGRAFSSDLEGDDRETELTADAEPWAGWGTALKPATEPICLARKPLVGTVAANVLAHGTGALNIDGCRIEMSDADAATIANMGGFGRATYERQPGNALELSVNPMPCRDSAPHAAGRWPANIIHDGSEEVLAGFPESEVSGSAKNGGRSEARPEGIFGALPQGQLHNDSGSAARFFASFPIGDDEWGFARNVHAARFAGNPCDLCGTPIAGDPAATLTLDSRSAASQAGLGSIGICNACIPILSHALNAESLESIGTIPTIPSSTKSNGSATPATATTIKADARVRAAGVNGPVSATRFLYCPKATTEERGEGNNHPTVKPVDLMRWLCRLVTPKGGTVLDPFCGSGSTLIAADAEQFNAIGCELSPDYAAIAERRVRHSGGMFAEVLAA